MLLQQLNIRIKSTKMEAVKSPVMLYTEQTPNPESLKFVTNRMIYDGTADFDDKALAQEWSGLAASLFELPFVKGVYISNNFVTITKTVDTEWRPIMIQLKEFIKDYLTAEKPIIAEGFSEAMEAKLEEKRKQMYADGEEEIVKKIIELIDNYVKPAVASDGGNIEFKSFHDGVVTVILQGSCSGCPSSTVTLKAGIEAMLKRMIPVVTEVVSEAQ